MAPRAGWLNTWERPDPCRVSTFIQGPSATGSGSLPLLGPLGPSAAVQWGNEGTLKPGATSTEIGVGVGRPAAEVSQTDKWKIGKLPWGLGW